MDTEAITNSILTEESLTEESLDWRRFYHDLDLRVVGTLSKGREARLSLAVLSASGDHLYAFLRENPLGHMEASTQPDDA